MCQADRILQGADSNFEDRVRTDLVRLIPFDVQIAMTGDPNQVNIYALTDVVTDWMNDSFQAKSQSQGLLGNNTSFQSVALELGVQNNGGRRRQLQDGSGPSAEDIGLYTSSFTGVSLWLRRGLATSPVDPDIVELIQRATFLEDGKLLEMLQAAEDYTGLGRSVVDVRAYVTGNAGNGNSNNGNGDVVATDSNLEIIIIIAICVACLAFALLLFAVVWAWKTDQSKKQAYKVGSVKRNPDGTGSESDYGHEVVKKKTPVATAKIVRPPAEIPSTSDYPDSVISEDISTSLTAYYRSGMTGYGVPKQHQQQQQQQPQPYHGAARELNDAASMSSMDSYGYSLDGYAPSLGPAQMGYPVGPITPGGALGTANEPTATQVHVEPDDADLVSSQAGDSTPGSSAPSVPADYSIDDYTTGENYTLSSEMNV